MTRAEARQEDRRPANGPASVARPSESAGCATAHRRVAGLVPREGDVSSEYQLTTPIKAIAPPSRVGTSPYHDVCQEQRQENSFNSASAIASEYYLLLAIASELLDMAMESMTEEEVIEVMLGGNPSAEPCSQRPLVPEEHGGPQAEGAQTTVGGETEGPHQQRAEETVARQETAAKVSGPPLSEQPPTSQEDLAQQRP